MRYDDWDVILFPKDSNVPTQEFNTACYVSSDEHGRQLPNLTCYIHSLPPSTPIRISLHSWAAVMKPSTLIESQRKPNQKVVYAVQVIIDGAGVFYFDLISKWPKEITHEKRTFAAEQLTSQRKPCLVFPPFHQQALMQSSWNIRDHSGRIKIMLSEQLISKTGHATDVNAGAANDIVCFSFQHAPKDVLERAGISWPVRNPLYLPTAHTQASLPSHISPPFPPAPKSRNPCLDSDIFSPSHLPKGAAKQQNAGPRRPHSHLPPISQFSKPPTATRGHEHAGVWDDGFTPVSEVVDYAIMDTANSIKQADPTSTRDTFMPDYLYTSSQPPQFAPLCSISMACGHSARTSLGDVTPAAVNIRDNQSLDNSSPPKRQHDQPPHGLGISHQNAATTHLRPQPHTHHTYFASSMQSEAFTNRQSSVAVARDSGYADVKSSADLNRNSTDNMPAAHYTTGRSRDKENRPAGPLRLPTPHPTSRIPAPISFTQGRRNALSDMSMRDASSLFPRASRFDRSGAPTPSQGGESHRAPFAPGTVKSRKEGTGRGYPLEAVGNVQHGQSLLPVIDHGTPTHPIEIIDLEAIDPDLATPLPATSPSAESGHAKENQTAGLERISNNTVGGGTGTMDIPTTVTAQHGPKSSMDSTSRLEQQLFSALGDELGGFGDGVDLAAHFTQAIGNAGENAVDEGDGKRKRETGEEDGDVDRGRKRSSGGGSMEETEDEEEMLGLEHGYSS